MHRLSSIFLIIVMSAAAANAQGHASTTCPKDLSWMLDYAAPNKKSNDDNEKLLNLPCFKDAIRKAFPAKQSMLGNDFPLSKAILNYVAVYGEGPQSFDNRYITIQGCYPHQCPSVGMIWIDTKRPGALIFAGSDEINPLKSPEDFHLWMVTTLPDLNQRQPLDLPEPFIRSLAAVFATEHFVSATVVHRDGRMENLMPETLHLNTSTPVAK